MRGPHDVLGRDLVELDGSRAAPCEPAHRPSWGPSRDSAVSMRLPRGPTRGRGAEALVVARDDPSARDAPAPYRSRSLQAGGPRASAWRIPRTGAHLAWMRRDLGRIISSGQPTSSASCRAARRSSAPPAGCRGETRSVCVALSAAVAPPAAPPAFFRSPTVRGSRDGQPRRRRAFRGTVLGGSAPVEARDGRIMATGGRDRRKDQSRAAVRRRPGPRLLRLAVRPPGRAVLSGPRRRSPATRSGGR